MFISEGACSKDARSVDSARLLRWLVVVVGVRVTAEGLLRRLVVRVDGEGWEVKGNRCPFDAGEQWMEQGGREAWTKRRCPVDLITTLPNWRDQIASGRPNGCAV